jgi:hypothetical protein
MCSIEIVRLSVRPSVRRFPIFSTFLHLESWKFQYNLRTICLPRLRPEFLIRGLEVLGLGPEPDPLHMGFFVSFITYFFSKLRFLCSIPWKMVFALVSDSTQKCLEVDPILGFKYSHLNISGPMHYRKLVSLEFLFVLLCSRTKTGWWCQQSHQKGGRPDPKFDDYTQNSSDLQCKFKNQSQNNSRAQDV